MKMTYGNIVLLDYGPMVN